MTPRDITEHAAHIMGYLDALKPEDRLAVWAEVMGQMWQPMETAKKDVPVLAFFPKPKIVTQARHQVNRLDGDVWASALDSFPDRWSYHPTHWLPLPTAPAKDTP